ncbi:hypothetical protein F3Y22_tig00110893pilonHSYRG00757 [Hibiscus syriacus]|uniref:Uncharacterized protein n=1 Tax=Hibiscus syriacus TaxID=106335 RepID=A0A6A2ZGU1_HIBSY|nr:hypothetical protein F3Y22_tig00110893pilonHSYRG00757 [Hibiscus syriacus]
MPTSVFAVYGCMDGWMDGWMDNSPSFSTQSVPDIERTGTRLAALPENDTAKPRCHGRDYTLCQRQRRGFSLVITAGASSKHWVDTKMLIRGKGQWQSAQCGWGCYPRGSFIRMGHIAVASSPRTDPSALDLTLKL